MNIRKLRGDEASLLRELRLRALGDSPTSFGETVEEAEARPDAYWESLTSHLTGSGPDVMILAHDGDVVFGSTYGLVDRNRRDAGRVGGMWVDPAARLGS